MLKIAVTGANGYIGSLLLKSLKKEKNIDISVFNHKNNSLFEISSLCGLFKDCEVVYHLAGIKNSEDPNLYNVNVLGTLNVLEAVRKVAPKAHIIFSSSFAVYKVPKVSEIINEKFTTLPRNMYGLTKLQAEELLNFYHRIYGIKSTILRISNVYGVDIFDKIFHQNNINIVRDYVYVDDVVSALIMAKKNNIKFSILNICSGTRISTNEIISFFSKKTKKNIKIDLNLPEGQDGYWKGDYSLSKKILGWKPEMDFFNRLEKIILENYSK